MTGNKDACVRKFLKVAVEIWYATFLQKTPTSTQPSLAEMFKKPEGSWECDTCMVSNKAAANKCIACETPKPGAPKPTSSKFSSFFCFHSFTKFQMRKYKLKTRIANLK